MEERIAYVAGGCGLLGAAIVHTLRLLKVFTYSVDAAPHADFTLDLADTDAFLRFFENRRMDVWVNASYPKDPMTHFRVFVETSKAVAGHMADHGGGSIVLLSSIYGLVGGQRNLYIGTEVKPVTPEYCAVKAGIIGLTRALASEYAPKVRVNCIAPGGVADNQDTVFRFNYSMRTPLQRMTTPMDVAKAVAFLAGDGASYITGVCLPVDGGWTCR